MFRLANAMFVTLFRLAHRIGRIGFPGVGRGYPDALRSFRIELVPQIITRYLRLVEISVFLTGIELIM